MSRTGALADASASSSALPLVCLGVQREASPHGQRSRVVFWSALANPQRVEAIGCRRGGRHKSTRRCASEPVALRAAAQAMNSGSPPSSRHGGLPGAGDDRGAAEERVEATVETLAVEGLS